jgi:adenine-specific DNA-methyltransferase
MKFRFKIQQYQTDVGTAITMRKPLYTVFRDSSFASEDAMVSFEQIFATFSPTTEWRII